MRPLLPPLVLLVVLGASGPLRAADVPPARSETLPRDVVVPPAPPGPAALDDRLRAALGGARTRTALAPILPTPGADGRLAVTVRVAHVDRAGLAAAGLAVERRARGVVEGRIAPAALRALAARPEVLHVRPRDAGVVQAGSVTSAGDAAARGELARATFRVDGSGVRVGVISDGIDGAAARVGTGDLAPVAIPADARCTAGSGAEGTAMLEIVHDVAPGAALRFAAGVESPLRFVEALACLVAAGTQVVVDDVGFPSEPAFEDGVVAHAAREAVAAGAALVSAAGNNGLVHWEGRFRTGVEGRWHRWGDGDEVNDVAIAGGARTWCVLQWDEPFGRARTDYDLVAFDGARHVISASRNVQTGRADPLEVVGLENTTGGTLTAGLAVERRRGPARTVALTCWGGALGLERAVAAGGIRGHQAVAEVITVGALDPVDVTVRPYGSRGPVTMGRPLREVRAKPDLAAADGVATATPGFAPFLGTSAAAPHVAGVAALLLQRDPWLRPDAVRAALADGAVDLPPAGRDGDSGAGRLDAPGALARTTPPDCDVDADCDDAQACTTERCERGRCVRGAVACDDGDPCNGTATCEAATGACLPGVPLPDGAPCPDADRCNGEETCTAARCGGGVAPACVDDDACTADACDPAAGCVFPALAGAESVRCLAASAPLDCEGATLPARVRRRIARALTLTDRAAAARRSAGERARLLGAWRGFERARRALGQAASAGRVAGDCAATLDERLARWRDRARAAAGR